MNILRNDVQTIKLNKSQTEPLKYRARSAHFFISPVEPAGQQGKFVVLHVIMYYKGQN